MIISAVSKVFYHFAFLIYFIITYMIFNALRYLCKWYKSLRIIFINNIECIKCVNKERYLKNIISDRQNIFSPVLFYVITYVLFLLLHWCIIYFWLFLFLDVNGFLFLTLNDDSNMYCNNNNWREMFWFSKKRSRIRR